MKKIIHFGSLLIITFGLFACSPMNSEFSCNATAIDRCLSIEEVNAMTEGGTPQKMAPVPHMQQGRGPRSAQNDSQTIWIAPWTDEQGNQHTNDTLFASNARAPSNQDTI